MYDISSWTSFQTGIKTDWTATIVSALQLTSSAVYAKQNGQPVVAIWGLGFPDRPGNAASWLDVVNWFKAQGCYVIGGVPRLWRTDSANINVYRACDMIQPWTVGSFKGVSGADNYRNTTLTNDFVYCNTNGIDYQPVAFPGFAWS